MIIHLRQSWSRTRKALPGRLKRGALPTMEAVIAATAAWMVASWLVGHPDPVLAPATALIVLSESRGGRLRQCVEIVLGVAAGVLVAELMVQALHPGTGAIVVVLLLTVGPMVAFGASNTLITQAAVSAVYLVVSAEPPDHLIPYRFVDALIGGAVAVVASQIVAAHRQLAPLVTEARQSFADLADLLDDVDAAVAACDEDAAQRALDRARRMTSCVHRLDAAVLAATEAVQVSPRRQRRLAQLRAVAATTRQLDHAVGNIWVLCRSASTLTRLHSATPPALSRALHALSAAVRAAGDALIADLKEPDDAAAHAARADEFALTAVRIAAGLLAAEPDLPVTMIVGQIRATAIDLLRGTGQPDADALTRVDKALGLTPQH
ncbi:FUSC family protein [Actinoplanes palleronii]|uniref:Integral membrane bound transporter domain-containing protein n=1 Tax=Actinoplanes palleronii TaxID=113570 RepID=A0ABQ4BQ09_9ACTN|nr:FUSC family protein [Actinoplanes palleronii]GIE72758.1 hypothetical protein Apa02nite_088660 [Actinoplanes palleronii]